MAEEKFIAGKHDEGHHIGRAGNRRREDAAAFEVNEWLYAMDEAGMTKYLQEAYLKYREKFPDRGTIYEQGNQENSSGGG